MSYLSDALLGSPIPPPRWLDPRHGEGWHAPRAGYFSGPFHVSGSWIKAELDDLNACVNPPVVQGWAWALALGGAAAVVLGLLDLKTARGDLSGLMLVLLPIPGWFLAVLVGGLFSFDIELRRGSLYVRRWTDVWFGLRGRLVGSRDSIHAVLSCGSHLVLEGDAGVIEVSLEMWPSSSRHWLESRFEAWEIELEFPGQHHVHHPEHWNHGHHRMGHRLPVQGHHRL